MAVQEAEWQPRKSKLEKDKAKSDEGGSEGAASGDPQAPGASQNQPLLTHGGSGSAPSSPTLGGQR